jgi:hypothetical protein
MQMINDFDTKTCAMFKGESIPTLGGWVRIGIRFSAAMRDGSGDPTPAARVHPPPKRNFFGAFPPSQTLLASVGR